MSEDILGRIAGWCLADPKLSYLEDGPAVEVAGDPPIRLGLSVTGEEVLLSHRLALTGAAGDAATRARSVVNRRGSLLRGTAQTEGDRLAVSIEYPIYLDGLNRQTFLLATQEMAGAVDAVASLGTAAPVEAAVPEEEAVPEPAVAPIPAVTPLPAVTPIPAVADTAEMPAAPPRPAAPFTATHEVPAGGMSAWARPDPSLQPMARLEARVQLRVDETRGAWARVTGSNGWTGWVDARRLAALSEAPTIAAVPAVAAAPAAAPPPTPAVPVQPAVWRATHQVPGGGLPAWASPDPAAAPIAQLAERVQLRVEENLGAWARVSAENGWSGWVDGRRLAGAGGGGAPAVGGVKIRPLALIGGVAVIVATFLNWLQFGDSNGFQVGLPFLWGGWESGGDNPDLGIFTLIIGIGVLLLAVLPRTSVALIRVLGLLTLVIAVVFVIQVMLWASDLGGGAGDAFTEGMSVAPYVALGGGLLMLLTRRD